MAGKRKPLKPDSWMGLISGVKAGKIEQMNRGKWMRTRDIFNGMVLLVARIMPAWFSAIPQAKKLHGQYTMIKKEEP